MGDKFPGARQVVVSLLAAVALAACGRASQDPQAALTDPSRATATMGAAPASAAAAQPAHADIAAGRTIAMKGANGAAACMSCHGANGEGNPQAGIPRLAGLARAYIEHQLDSFADGNRAQPVMTPVAGGLTPQQRAAVAAFYSTLGSAAPGPAATPAANVPVLAVQGDEKRGLQACAKCHGAQGAGDAGATPSLAGQNAQYFVNAIGEWKDGSRHNDPGGRMPAIAKALGDGEVRELAAYYAALPPPAPPHDKGTQQGSAPTGGAPAQGPASAASHPVQTTRQRPTASAAHAR